MTPEAARKRSVWQVVILTTAFLIIVAVTGLSLLLTQQLREENKYVVRSFEIQREILKIQLEMRRAESSVRSFLLSGSTDALQKYEESIGEIPQILAELRGLSGADPGQLDAGNRLQTAIANQLIKFEDAIRIGKAAFAANPALARPDIPDEPTISQVREISTKLFDEETRDLQENIASADNTQRLVSRAAIAGALLVLLLAGFSAHLIRRSLRARDYAAAQLRHSNDDLEIAVAERTADLQEANHEIQRFAYIVSHDLRAPLVNIMGFTTELEQLHGTMVQRLGVLAGLEGKPDGAAPSLAEKDKQLATDFLEATGFIRSSVEKMDRLISAILRMTREGRREFTPEAVSLKELMESIVTTLAHQVSQADATVIIRDLPTIASDRLSLEQIFSNLLENALKYLKPDVPGLIEVRGGSRPGYVIIEVIDNGCGIALKDHQRIFDLFRRAGKQDKPGQGIGLAHARALVRKLGGALTVESQLDKGSTFTITLPTELPQIGPR